MELLLLALLVSAALVGWWHWENHVRRRPLDEFGIENVHRVLRFEPQAARDRILARGWMTRCEWIEINSRQAEAIDAELRRRDVGK